MSDLPGGRLRAISARSFGSTQMPLWAVRLAQGCVSRINGFNRFCKSAAETFVEAVIDLAGVNQIVSVATADVDAVPFFFVEREARDGKHLPLRPAR